MNRPAWEHFIEVAKDVPIAGTGAVLVMGIPLSHVILVATAIWAVARVFEIGLNIYWKWKDRREQGK